MLLLSPLKLVLDLGFLHDWFRAELADVGDILLSMCCPGGVCNIKDRQHQPISDLSADITANDKAVCPSRAHVAAGGNNGGSYVTQYSFGTSLLVLAQLNERTTKDAEGRPWPMPNATVDFVVVANCPYFAYFEPVSDCW